MPKKMTAEERDADCYCDSYPDDSTLMCHHCENYYDDHCEEFEEQKRRRIQEQNEY